MPLVSTHCFANHRGGVGKTTLTFQVSAAYALAHPLQKVLVIDASDGGDVSEMLMGGLFEKRGRDALIQLVPLANTTRLFLRALACHSSAHLKDAVDQDSDISTIVSKVMDDMPKVVGEKGFVGVFQNKGFCNISVNIEEFAIPLRHVNARIPPNMYLCPSGLDVDQSIAFSELQRHSIISVLRESLKQVDGDWKVFIDTDAGFENDIYGSIAMGISDFCLVPLHADMADWYRVGPLLTELKTLRASGFSDAKIQMILWNGLTVKFNSQCFSVSASGASKKCNFTPTKAEQDVIRSLNELVFKDAEKNPGLFYHYEGSGMDADEFHSKSSICVRNFSIVGVASRDSGIPIACISAGAFHGAHMTYMLNEATIERCRENLNEIVKAINVANATKVVSGHEKVNVVGIQSSVGRSRFAPGNGSKSGGKAHTLKRKRRASAGDADDAATPVLPKVYNTRNKYPLRDRVHKSHVPLGLVELTEHSSTSTIM